MPRAANKTSIEVSKETREILKARLTPGETVDSLITRLLATPQGEIEVTDKVKDAIALGANLDELVAAGLDWAARQYIARKTYRNESGFDFATMTDSEIEAIPASEAKRLGGVTEQRIARTVARLEAWNQANGSNPNMVIAIGPSFVSALREEIKLLTDGRIGAPNRNAIFAYFNQPGSAITPQDLPQRHNATTKAISHGVQAFKDLIDGAIAPEMQHRYQSHLNHRADS
jgi:hypothetical protein